MSKALALLVGGAGATAVSVGGVYLFTGRGSSKQSSPTDEVVSKNVDFADLSAFKAANGGKCVVDLFTRVENIQSLVSSEEFATNKPNDSDFFGSDATNIKGCLIINWEKKENENKSKWSGIFTWAWAFVKENKGFITFNVIKTVGQNNMNMSGGAYLLAKESSNGSEKWNIKYHKEEINTSSPKAISNGDEFEKYFPKVKSGGVVNNENKPYWGFVESKERLSSICGGTDCETGLATLNPFKKRWTWTSGTEDGSNKLADWVTDLKWWEHLYGNSPFNLENKINNFSGKWVADAES